MKPFWLKSKIINGIEYGPINFVEWLFCKLGFHFYIKQEDYRCFCCGKRKKNQNV